MSSDTTDTNIFFPQVRKISAHERYGSNPSLQPSGSDPSIRIYVSSGPSTSAPAPIVEILPMYSGEASARRVGQDKININKSDGKSGPTPAFKVQLIDTPCRIFQSIRAHFL